MNYVNGKRIVDPTIKQWEVNVDYCPTFAGLGWKKKVEAVGGSVGKPYNRDGHRTAMVPNTTEGCALIDQLLVSSDMTIRFIVARGPIEGAQSHVVVVSFDKKKPDCERNMAAATALVEKRFANNPYVISSNDPVAVAAREEQAKKDSLHRAAYAFQGSLIEKMKTNRRVFWEVVKLLDLDIDEAVAFQTVNKADDSAAA